MSNFTNKGLSLIEEYFEEHGIDYKAVFVNEELIQLRVTSESDSTFTVSFAAIDNRNGFRMSAEGFVTGILKGNRAVFIEACNNINKNPIMLYFKAFLNNEGDIGLHFDMPSVPDDLVGEIAYELLLYGKDIVCPLIQSVLNKIERSSENKNYA